LYIILKLFNCNRCAM